MEIELIEVEVLNEEGQHKWVFASTINGKEYQTESIISDVVTNLFDFIQRVVESVVKQFEEFEKKLNKR